MGPALAATLFLLLRFVCPLLLPAAKPGSVDGGLLFRPMFATFAWLATIIVLAAWVVAECYKLINRRLLDSRTDLASLCDISWQKFEELVGEAYRRKGYAASVVGNSFGDGGVDIELTRPGELVLVQCKQWKVLNVDVTVVREMLGVVVSRQANKGIVVTCGRFTDGAHRFAEEVGSMIQLVDGEELADLVQSVQASVGDKLVAEPLQHQSIAETAKAAPSCPTCNAVMVLRMARRGANAGSRFWGCPKYPGCRGTRPLTD